jgi:hypothetical protein
MCGCVRFIDSVYRCSSICLTPRAPSSRTSLSLLVLLIIPLSSTRSPLLHLCRPLGTGLSSDYMADTMAVVRSLPLSLSFSLAFFVSLASLAPLSLILGLSHVHTPLIDVGACYGSMARSSAHLRSHTHHTHTCVHKSGAN